MGVTEAGLALDIPKSSAHALMSSLASIGLLQRGQMGRYRLGWRISSLNRLLMTTTQFREISREAMERLHGRFRDTVHLGVLDGPDVVFLEIVRSAHSVPVPGADTGERKPAARISLGKALLACRPWEEVQAFYRPHKSASRITSAWSGDIDELERELAIIRMQGYALYSSSDFFAVGAPIWDYSGEVVAALSMSVPASRFEFHQQRYVGAVIESELDIRSARRGKIIEPSLARTVQIAGLRTDRAGPCPLRLTAALNRPACHLSYVDYGRCSA